MCLSHLHFAVLFFLLSCCINSLLLEERRGRCIHWLLLCNLQLITVKFTRCNCSFQPSVDNNKTGVFGVCLEKVESVNVGEDFYCSVPK